MRSRSRRIAVLVPVFTALALAWLAAPSRSEDGPSPDMTITGIVIKGGKGNDEAILSQMRIRKGGSYTAEEFEKLIDGDTKHLYSHVGVFVKRITPRFPKGPTRLEIEVEIRSKIVSIEFDGLSQFDDDEVLPSLMVRTGSATDEALLNLSCDRLGVMYRNDGYRFAKIDYKLKPRGGNRADLVFQIIEGPRTRIDDIVFIGNRSISSRDLRRRMETSRSDLLTAERLDDDKLARDVAALEQYYREEGWRDATVSLSDLAFNESLSKVRIVIRVREGRRFVVRSVRVAGNTAVETVKLMRAVRLKPGQFYRYPMVFGNYEEEEKGDAKRIRDIYGELGHLNVGVRPEETFDDAAKAVDVVYKIDEGPRISIRRVLFRGNYKTRDDVMRRLLGIRPGRPAKFSEIERSYRNLNSIRYFDRIDLRFMDTGVPDVKDVMFEVEEARTGDIRFIAAYNQSTQFMGRVALRLRNFDLSRFPTTLSELLSGRAFSGGNQTLTIQVTAGMESQVYYEFRFDEPNFFGTDNSFSLNLFSRQRDYGPYLERRLGGYLEFGRNLAPFLWTGLRYRLEGVELDDISEGAPQDIFDAAGPDVISSLTGMIRMDLSTKDMFGQPYEGLDTSLSYEFAGGPLQGSVEFQKAEFEATYYHTLFGNISEWRHILAVRAKVGWAAPHGDASEVPIYERFFLGGMQSLRGFAYREVGPREMNEPVGGCFRVLGGIEYSIPLYRAQMPGTWRQEMDVLRFVLFYDVGALSATLDDYSPTQFRSAIGFGFRLRVPALGGIPIALDFGWPLAHQPGDRHERVSFSLGFFFF